MAESVHSSTSFNANTYKHTITKEPEANNGMSFSYAKEFSTPKANGYQKFINKMGKVFGTCGIVCFLCSNPYEEVQQGEVGLVQTFGALSRVVDPGLTYVNTWSEHLTRVNIKTNIREIPSQRSFTRDNVSVTITSVVYYNIIDPQKAIFAIDDIHSAIMERTQTTLRDVIGGRILQDVVEKRDEVAEAIEHIISKTAADWGVSIESILIKDLQLPPSVQSSLSMAAEAKRIGESKIITAKAAVESAKLMRKAADILASKPAMQIRYLDAMQAMASSANSKVIFMPAAPDVDVSKAGARINYNEEEPDLEESSEWLTKSGEHGNIQKIANTLALQESLDHDGTGNSAVINPIGRI